MLKAVKLAFPEQGLGWLTLQEIYTLLGWGGDVSKGLQRSGPPPPLKAELWSRGISKYDVSGKARAL